VNEDLGCGNFGVVFHVAICATGVNAALKLLPRRGISFVD
jgi:hypothetical protein